MSPVYVESVPSKPTTSVPFERLALITLPEPESDPTLSVRPFTFNADPAPRSRREEGGTASPLAVTTACETDAGPDQAPSVRSKRVAEETAVWGSNPENARGPAANTGTCTISWPLALRENPAPRTTIALSACEPACTVTSPATATDSDAMTRVPSSVTTPGAAKMIAAVPSSGGTAGDQFPASVQRPVPAAPV